MSSPFKLALLTLVLGSRLCAAITLPDDFAAALKLFKAEGAKHWGFTQATVTSKTSLTEQYDPSKPELKRWTLLQLDGRSPTEKELKDYSEKQTRRSSNDTAPDVTKQLDQSTAELVAEDAERATYLFHLKSGGKDDSTAAFMVASFVFHKATRTIEQVELKNTAPFSPMTAVKVQEAKTTIKYTLPTTEQPSLLQHITMRVRGRAMFFKSLDEDMEISYSDYRYSGKVPVHPPAEAPAK